MLNVQHLIGFGAAGNLAPPVLTFHALTQSGSSLTTYTFNSQAIGSENESRCVIVAVVGASGSSIDVASVTVNSVSATVGRAAGASNRPVEIWIARVPTGTSVSIVVTFTGGATFCGIGVWDCTGLDSTTPTDTATASDGDMLIDVATAGVVICASSSINGASSTWTNATERFDTSSGSVGDTGADYQATAGPETNRNIICVSADANELAVAVAWR